MHRQILLILFLLGLSVTAAADFRTLSEAHEVDLVNLRLPGTEFGTVAYKPCADCTAQTSRVNAKTRYSINGRAYSLPEFKRRLNLVRDPKMQNVSVLQHLQSNTVKVIELWIR